MAWVVLGLLSVVYGVTVMMLRSGRLFYVVWFAIGAVLLASGWMTYAGTWSSVPAVLRFAFGTVLAVVLVVLVWTQALILSHMNDRCESELDYVVVLGAQVYPDGIPSPALRYRLDAALAYLHAHPAASCIVSGGQGSNEPCSEADCMASFLHGHGVSPGRIIKEGRSANTRQNIAYSVALMGDPNARVGVVTNGFHMFRTLRIARHTGLSRVCGISVRSSLWYLPNNLLRESLAIVKDLICH